MEKQLSLRPCKNYNTHDASLRIDLNFTAWILAGSQIAIVTGVVIIVLSINCLLWKRYGINIIVLIIHYCMTL